MTPSYRLRECPYCHKHFANVRNHIRMKHGLEPAPADLTAEDLLGVKRPRPAEPEPRYFCTGCGQLVARGQLSCSRCGEDLDWSSV